MKIRIYYPQYPFPPQDGSSWVVAGQVQAFLALGHEVELLTWFGRGPSANKAPAFIHNRMSWTHLDLGLPASQLARALQSVFSGRSMPELAHYPWALADRLDNQGLGPADVGIYNYSFAAGLLTKGSKREKKTISYFHNWESNLSNLRARTSSPASRFIHDRNARMLAQAEEGLLQSRTVDELWFISPTDYQEALRRGAPSERSRMVCPTLPETLALERRPAPQEGETHRFGPLFGMIGRLDFEPNYRSAAWIVEQLAPELARRKFQGAIEIIGRHAPRALIERARPYPFIRFEGFVDDVASYWRRWSGFLVPDHGGSGVRIKLLEAVASQVPVLTNEAALERVTPEIANLPGVLLQNSPEEWARSLTELDWRKLRAEATTTPFPAALNGPARYRELGF